MNPSKMDALIQKLKKIAQDNYAHGGDHFIECCDRNDWIEFIEESEGKPVTHLRKMMKLHAEKDREMQNSIW